MGASNPKGHTSNLWGKCPLCGSNATGRLVSKEIHYQPIQPSKKQSLEDCCCQAPNILCVVNSVLDLVTVITISCFFSILELLWTD